MHQHVMFACVANDHDDKMHFMSDRQAHIFPGPTIQTYEGSTGSGIMALNSGTVPAIRGPLRTVMVSCD